MNQSMLISDIDLIGSIVITPQIKGNLEVELTSILAQIKETIINEQNRKFIIIKQTYFVNISSNSKKQELRQLIYKQSSDIFKSSVPLSIIPQEPLNEGTNIIAEFTIMANEFVKKMETNKVDEISYVTIHSSYGKLVIAAGLEEFRSTSDILSQSIYAFQLAEKILENENMSFGHIIRQWNYIEDIIGFTDNNQHYQIFNDVRTSFYSKSHFLHGYPAATGIGMMHGGVIIDFVALLPEFNTQIFALHSPVQVSAHQYSEQVLFDTHVPLNYKKTTPKFERGKIVLFNDKGLLFVSGTAAIKGEMSATNLNAAVQTEMTMQNIMNLIDKENIQRHGIDVHFQLLPAIYRVYIKNFEDYRAVKEIVQSYLPDVNVIYLHADICRQELLVEIEAVYYLV